ncbi:hypothetical protein PINS_up002827 [Pythium insidiosum]|nr:hypothetical protein PINS_up002827 [Pythium insidiosum]
MNASNELEKLTQSLCTSSDTGRVKIKAPLPGSISAQTPLPATQLFWSKLKGKRRRNYTIDELQHDSPMWMMIKHMNRFFQSALMFERRHAQFLQLNIDRIMKADAVETQSTKVRHAMITVTAV